MAERTNTTTTPAPDAADTGALTEAVAAVNDPGGAHRKGYSAEPGTPASVPPNDPVPLVADDEVHAHVHKPDQSQASPGSTSPGGASDGRVLGMGR